MQDLAIAHQRLDSMAKRMSEIEQRSLTFFFFVRRDDARLYLAALADHLCQHSTIQRFYCVDMRFKPRQIVSIGK